MFVGGEDLMTIGYDDAIMIVFLSAKEILVELLYTSSDDFEPGTVTAGAE